MSPSTIVGMFVVLCLKAHPDVCGEPKPIVLPEPPSLLGCMIMSQQAGADYMNKHPMLARLYFVGRVNCSFSGMRDGHVG